VKRETLVVSLLVESLEHHSVAIRVIRFTSVNVFHYSIPGREASSTPVSMRGRGSTLAGVHPLKGAYALHDATHGSGRDSKRGSEFTDQDVDSRFYPRETSYPSNPYHDRSGSWVITGLGRVFPRTGRVRITFGMVRSKVREQNLSHKVLVGSSGRVSIAISANERSQVTLVTSSLLIALVAITGRR
jgi:hypothetical protein